MLDFPGVEIYLSVTGVIYSHGLPDSAHPQNQIAHVNVYYSLVASLDVL